MHALLGAPAVAGAEEMHRDEPAFIFYTSGTTGTPKGAVLPQRVIHGHVPGFRTVFDDGPQPGDVFWTPSDWSWIGALGEVALPVAFHGYPLVATAERFSVAMAYRVLAEHGVTCPFLAPAVIRRMRAEPPADPIGVPAARDHDRRRGARAGGARVHRGDVRLRAQRHLRPDRGQPPRGRLRGALRTPPGAIGRAVPGRRIAILDRAGAELPPGSSGEIALAADDPIVMLGYWGRPDLTARKIVGGWVRLGDRGLLDADGFLHFEGRLDDLIKVSGIQVGAEEVEAALLGHPAVAEAGVCAVARPDGGGDTVAAFVRLRPGATVDPDGAAGARPRRASARTPTPRVVEFVDALPDHVVGQDPAPRAAPPLRGRRCRHLSRRSTMSPRSMSQMSMIEPEFIASAAQPDESSNTTISPTRTSANVRARSAK